MPKFFFHTEDGRCQQDEQGTDLIDVHAARNEAVVILAEVLKDDPEEFWKDRSFKLTVTDARGLTLYILDVSAVASSAVERPRPR
ncbi:MAG: DUF6894 family protein [Phenylobacterium sp.]